MPGQPVNPDRNRKADVTLINALVRAHRWNQWLAQGKYQSVKEIATAEGITSPSYGPLWPINPYARPLPPQISMLQVALGFDVADNAIVKKLNAGDLVVTSDFPWPPK